MSCKNVMIVTSYDFKTSPTYSNTLTQATFFSTGIKKVRWAISAEFLVLKNTNIINSKSNAAAPKEFWRRKKPLTPSQPPSK